MQGHTTYPNGYGNICLPKPTYHSIKTNDIYQVKGKATHKEEFVTCGGVSLESIDLNTMQSKVYKNLYFAGEVLDVDAVTGGYNLQAAWTTGYIAGQLK
jgi:predicted flavoprotein YhiN